MKQLRLIAVALPLLVLLVFGRGGVGLLHCACSGKLSLLSIGHGCCKADAKCMTLTVCGVSDSEAAPAPQAHQPATASLAALPAISIGAPATAACRGSVCAPQKPSPPGYAAASMVMRV